MSYKLQNFLEGTDEPIEEGVVNVDETTTIEDGEAVNINTPQVEDNVETPIETATEVVTPQDEVQSTEEVQEPIKKTVKFDLDKYLAENKESLKKYLNDSDTDYSKLDNLEALRIQLKNEHSEWDDEEVEAELQEKYKLHLKDLDVDDLSEEDLKALKNGERLLKSDAKKAKAHLESIKATFDSLPELSMELDVETPKEVAPTFNPEDYVKELQEQNQKQKEEVWIPTIKNTLNEIESLTEAIPYEDGNYKGEIKVNYKLSETEKQEVLNHLSEYVANPSDDKYINQDGSVNYKGFVADKAKELNFSKILKTAVKEARASAREDFIEKDLVNYSEEVRNVTTTETEMDTMDFFLKKSGKKV